MTMDLHADQGFLKTSRSLVCFYYFLPYVKSLELDNDYSFSDMGGSKPMRILSFRIRCSYLLQTKKSS
jgi:hypothetical protein